MIPRAWINEAESIGSYSVAQITLFFATTLRSLWERMVFDSLVAQ
jgi:hypothetical protein